MEGKSLVMKKPWKPIPVPRGVISEDVANAFGLVPGKLPFEFQAAKSAIGIEGALRSNEAELVVGWNNRNRFVASLVSTEGST
ncbi:MAG: hypothetical protein JSW08_00125 [archaeon]|nr:MAG: hypothetical protein JSW08_00125 [archaeon]